MSEITRARNFGCYLCCKWEETPDHSRCFYRRWFFLHGSHKGAAETEGGRNARMLLHSTVGMNISDSFINCSYWSINDYLMSSNLSWEPSFTMKSMFEAHYFTFKYCSVWPVFTLENSTTTLHIYPLTLSWLYNRIQIFTTTFNIKCLWNLFRL